MVYCTYTVMGMVSEDVLYKKECSQLIYICLVDTYIHNAAVKHIQKKEGDLVLMF